MATGYLKVFVDWRERYQKLSDAEFGRLVRAAIAYKADGVVPQLNGREDLVWDGIKIDIDMDNERYSAVCEAKSEAGRRGAEARWGNKREKPNGKDGKSHLPNGKDGQEEDKEKDKEYISAPAEQNAHTRHRYGQYDNVLLSDEDLAKLKTEFPRDWQQRIDRISEYVAKTGKGYKNYLAAIRSWARNDKPQPAKEPEKKHSWMKEYL